MSKILYFLFFVVFLAVANLSAQSTTLTANPTSLTFNYVQGATTLPAALKLTAKASSGTPNFQAVADVTQPWLIVAPDFGNLPATLSVRVNPTGLDVGQYPSSIVISTTVGGILPVTVLVTLNVTAPPPTLSVNPTTLAVSGPTTALITQAVTLSTSGAPISFAATAAAPWLSISPKTGVVVPGGATLTITVDPTALSPSTKPYASKVTITVSGQTPAPKPQVITVTLTVNATTPAIQSVWPLTVPVNGGAQTITIRGLFFYSATVASIGSTPLATTVLSDSVLLAVVPATQLTAVTALNLIVTNPPPAIASPIYPLQVVTDAPAISPNGIQNAASYIYDSVSPGELVSIFGTNIGPTAPAAMLATAPGATVDTVAALGGVTLSIGGVAAPLLYVSQNQVTAQVPYEVVPGPNVPVILTLTSLPTPVLANVLVSSTAPGLFTADGSGIGQAAALNYVPTTRTYTLNTAATPARLGDIVLLYLTGEGAYVVDPTLGPPFTGLIVPDTWFSAATPPTVVTPQATGVIVNIGGATATVNYAGPVMGSILGLLQINCVVPAASSIGIAVPVSVTIGGSVTKTGVTLSIHL